MHFKTEPGWEEKNPMFRIFDTEGYSCARWNIVETTTTNIVYHLHIQMDGEDCEQWRDFIIANLGDALMALKEHPLSTIDIQIPPCLNDGEPCLLKVIKLYLDKDTKNHIAECSNGKMYFLDLGLNTEYIDPYCVVKKVIWTCPSKLKAKLEG